MRRLLTIFLASSFLVFTFAASTVIAAQAPVKLGFVYIMSGPFATYGQFAKQGAELAIDEINRAGGINGRKIEAFFDTTKC